MNITSVLELYTEYDGVPSPRFVAVFPIDNVTWTEETYTPDDFLERYFTEKVVHYVTNEETWYEWNVTDIIVKTVTNGSSVVAFAMMYDTSEETDPILFTSKEGSVTRMPKLTVFWTSINPEPTPEPTTEPTPTPEPTPEPTTEPTPTPNPTPTPQPIVTPTPSPTTFPTREPTPTTEPQSEPFPTTLVAIASVISASITGAGLLVYFKKRKS
jgi:hypothetical protein